TIHLVAAKRVLRYISGTITYGLFFRKGNFLRLTAFSNSDWAGYSIDRRSTTGYVLFLGSNPVSWGAKKQSTVSRSSTKVEYRALSSTAAELFWTQQLLRDLCVFG
ncbi:MAG: Ty1/Copia family ribonuclease HI, partial [Sweet potato little leaf phytoplasma]|nr:Ty1/Copia family ribonuclease HI [Sweet potato little leaf phytoplasma]